MQRSPEFLKPNPPAAIPALIVPGKPPLTQSLAILAFLEALQASAPVLPTDLYGRAQVGKYLGTRAAPMRQQGAPA